MDKMLPAKDVYEYLNSELKVHKIDKLCTLELDTVEDVELEEDIDYLTWKYEPISKKDLDAQLYYDDKGLATFDAGPVHITIEFDNTHSVKDNLLKTILMVMNGQFKLVVTYPEARGLDRFQAAELYLLGLEKQPTVLRVVSNHNRSSKNLATIVLSNNGKLDAQIITPAFWLLPEKTNGKYPQGRQVNLDSPTPLSRSEYKQLDNSLTVQQLGGEPSEPFWSYFYRTTEFWAVTIPVVLFDIWLIQTFFPQESILTKIAKGAIHVANTFIVIFLTSLLLKRRQAKLNANQTPRFERTEDMISLLGISRLLAVVSVCVLLFAPLWTPVGDYTNLFPGTKYIFTYPMILVGCLLMCAPLFFNKTGKRGTKLFVTVLYTIGIVLIFTANSLYMNTADNAPQPALQWTILGLIVPVTIAIWMWYKTFAKPNHETPSNNVTYST